MTCVPLQPTNCVPPASPRNLLALPPLSYAEYSTNAQSAARRPARLLPHPLEVWRHALRRGDALSAHVVQQAVDFVPHLRVETRVHGGAVASEVGCSARLAHHSQEAQHLRCLACVRPPTRHADGKAEHTLARTQATAMSGTRRSLDSAKLKPVQR
eukprot:726121-Pleurochrysis_carterae.AAC.2